MPEKPCAIAVAQVKGRASSLATETLSPPARMEAGWWTGISGELGRTGRWRGGGGGLMNTECCSHFMCSSPSDMAGV